MDLDKYAELATETTTASLAVSSHQHCATLLSQLNALRSWTESRTLAVTRRLNELAAESPGIFPEQTVADATRVSLTQALQPFKRARRRRAAAQIRCRARPMVRSMSIMSTCWRVVSPASTRPPSSDWRIGTGSSPRSPRERPRPSSGGPCAKRSVARRPMMGSIGCSGSVVTPGYGPGPTGRPGCGACAANSTPKPVAILQQRLNDAIEALFHDTTPDTCPTDPLEKQHHLRALALFSLTAGKSSGRGGRIDMSVLIDAKTLLEGVHEHSVIDCGLGIELPVETLRRMACCAEITPIIVGADGVHMELGRTTRLASREQRRALRAMYRGCAIPGCCVAWDYVVIHHLKWFRNLGTHGYRQSVAVMHQTPSPRPRRPLATPPRPPTQPHHHQTRRHTNDHRPTNSPRGMNA